MKQVKFLAIALVVVIAGSFAANAQKIGYVNIDGLVYALPEAQKVQQDFEKWQQDSIGGTYTRLANEFQEKDSLAKAATNASVKSALQNDVNRIGQILNNWQQEAQQWMQQKQGQMFSPLYKKVTDAVDAYIKEKGYTYVLHSDNIYKAPDADNISMAVAPKLGIKINNQGTAAPQGAAPAAGK
jgi:outer membrane protein